jgi:RHS repeat-associated protein
MNAKRLFGRLAACLLLTASSAALHAQQSWTSGTFSYDAVGNITAIGSDSYFYDTAGRLVHGTADGTANVQEYTYDSFGNRLTVSTAGRSCVGTGTCGASFTIDGNNNKITTGGASYGTAGNMEALGGYTYGYDGATMMSSLTAPNGYRYDYIYTAEDERVATYTGGGNWQFTIRGLDGKVLREMTAWQPSQGTATWTWDRDHVWRNGQLLATVSPSGTEQFHLDHLGTPRVVTDAAGHKIGYHAYYPFGEELNLGSNEFPAERLKFTSHERDTVLSSSLDYMHARFNSAASGRFLSVDPELNLKATIHNPQKWNRYSYVVNNPILYRDPTGKQEAAGFSMDRDVQDLLAHRINEQEYWARINARGWGALAGASPWAGWWGIRGLMSLFGAGATMTAAGGGGGTVLLGETVAERVQPVADEIGAETFSVTERLSRSELMARNMAWLQDKIASGSRIFDIGLNPARTDGGSPYYAAEVKTLMDNGFVRQFVRIVIVDGRKFAMYEWIKK